MKTRRNLIAGAVTAVAATSAKAQTNLEKKVIRSGPKPTTPPLFSGTVQYGNLLFLSGVGYHKEGDITVHTEGVLADIKKQLEAARSSMNKVLKCTVFLANGADYKAMNDVFRSKF